MSPQRGATIRFMGIDPGLLRTGYACIEMDRHSVVRIVEAGILKLSPKKSIAQRLVELDTDLGALIAELKPDRIAVEQIFAHPAHVRTAIIMAHARGVVLLAAERARLKLNEFAPATIKSAVAGNGQATKSQMQLAVAAQCGLSKPPSPADVADAIAIALTDARRVGRVEPIAAIVSRRVQRTQR
ncbi:MAG: Holliday junction resolvase [Phycisphaerales bacterium]|nr:Holliday junction resolvase [Phycisphaerales bacterium]